MSGTDIMIEIDKVKSNPNIQQKFVLKLVKRICI